MIEIAFRISLKVKSRIVVEVLWQLSATKSNHMKVGCS